MGDLTVAEPEVRSTEAAKCACGDPLPAGEEQCDHCAWVATQPPHVGHFAMTGWFCDTCQSPYCDLA